MAEFLVHIEVRYPPAGDPGVRAQLVAAEAARAAELAAEGHILRIWRIPGRWANWGLWRADDASQLHDLLGSLPFFPWLDIEVHPLARHPNDPSNA